MRYRLGKEISHLLLVKLLGLFVLWYLCFSHPVKHNLTTGKIAQHIFGPAPITHTHRVSVRQLSGGTHANT